MAGSLLTRAVAAVVMASLAGLCGPLLADSRASSTAPVRVSPASPLSSGSFTARWRAPEARRKGRRYGVELRVSAPDGSLCTTARSLVIRRHWNKKDTLTFRLRPNDKTLGGESLWCPGRATLKVSSTKPGTRRITHATFRFRIREDPANPVPKGTPIETELLDGSQMTVEAPGRAPRTSALSGRMTGRLPGAGNNSAGVTLELSEGTLTLDGLGPDPLCAPGTGPGADRIDLASSGSRGRLLQDGSFSMTLKLASDPIALTGCQGPEGAAARRSVELSGRGTPDGDVSRIEAGGAIAGLTYSDGTEARIVLRLVFSLDLSAQ